MDEGHVTHAPHRLGEPARRQSKRKSTAGLNSHEATGDSDQKKWRMPMSKAEDDWFGPVVAPAIARAESFSLKMRASVE